MLTADQQTPDSTQPASGVKAFLAHCANPSPRISAAMVIVMVVLGSAHRLWQYAQNWSFWRDEAYLLLNIMDKTPAQLLGPLSNAQSSPPAFLLLEKWVYSLAGAQEWAMRLEPLMAGVLGLCLFALLAWRLLKPATALYAVAFFAFCDELMTHAISMKQYSGDAMFSAILLLLAWHVYRSARPAVAFVGLTAVAGVSIWFSMPSVLVFAGLSLALGPTLWRRSRGGRIAWLAGNLVYGLSVALLFFLVARHQKDPSLFDFWGEDMADPSRPWLFPWVMIRESYRLCEVCYRAAGPLTALLVLVGMHYLWKSGQRTLLALLTLPVLMTMAAAALRQYPYHGGRLTVFLLPMVMILAAAGLQAGYLAKDWRSKWWWLAGVPLLALGMGEAALRTVQPMGRSHIRPVVAYMKAHRQPGEAIYLLGEGPNPQRPAIEGGNLELYCYWRNPEAPVEQTMPADVREIPYRRFWVSFATLTRHNGTRYLDPLLNEIRKTADEKDHIVVKEGGAAFLFEKR